MELNFEEQILEAAKSIAAATAALVKSASAAQRELVAQGKVRSLPLRSQPYVWFLIFIKLCFRMALISSQNSELYLEGLPLFSDNYIHTVYKLLGD